MRIERTGIEGLALLHWQQAHDSRGSFARTFCRAELEAAGLPFEVVQANLSRNPVRHTLRGLHLQQAPHDEPKIVSCARGRIWDVAVDVRPGSPTYRQWRGFELCPEADRALYVAAGFAHGFLTLEPDSEVHYLMGGEFVPEASAGIRWNDPALGIAWPAEPALVSERDSAFPDLDPACG